MNGSFCCEDLKSSHPKEGQSVGQDTTGSEGQEGNLENLASVKDQDGYFPSITGQEGYLLAKGSLTFVAADAEMAIASTAAKENVFFIMNLN